MQRNTPPPRPLNPPTPTYPWRQLHSNDEREKVILLSSRLISPVVYDFLFDVLCLCNEFILV